MSLAAVLYFVLTVYSLIILIPCLLQTDLHKCFQKAETFLYDMVAGGEVMYRKSLRTAIDGQAKARKTIAEALPSNQWTMDN